VDEAKIKEFFDEKHEFVMGQRGRSERGKFSRHFFEKKISAKILDYYLTKK
jgi:hypothetical protein